MNLVHVTNTGTVVPLGVCTACPALYRHCVRPRRPHLTPGLREVTVSTVYRVAAPTTPSKEFIGESGRTSAASRPCCLQPCSRQSCGGALLGGLCSAWVANIALQRCCSKAACSVALQGCAP